MKAPVRHERSAYSAPQGDRNDCTVRALAVALALPYKECHALYAAAGRRNGRSTPVKICIYLLPDLGLRRLEDARGGSLAGFAAAHPRGRFVVHVASHALAVINGVVHDWRDGPRRRVKRAWEVPQ